VLRDIESITLQTYQSAIDFCNRVHPATELEAKFSLQHCVAVVLLRGAPTMADFDEAGFRDPLISRLRERVYVIEDATMTRQFPQHYAAAITIMMRDGKSLSHHQADAKGDPELPLSTDEIIAKARALLGVSGIADVEKLINATLNLAATTHVTNWTKAWRSSAADEKAHANIQGKQAA
jgi:2-methylcitrate dehydratase PrpD